MAPRDLIRRTELFSLAVFAFCSRLPKTKEAQEPADQLRRAANGMRMITAPHAVAVHTRSSKPNWVWCSKKPMKLPIGSVTFAILVYVTIVR